GTPGSGGGSACLLSCSSGGASIRVRGVRGCRRVSESSPARRYRRSGTGVRERPCCGSRCRRGRAGGAALGQRSSRLSAPRCIDVAPVARLADQQRLALLFVLPPLCCAFGTLSLVARIGRILQ